MVVNNKRNKPSSAPATPPRPGVVLVVDDDRSTRLLLKKVLGHSGFSVELAEDGARAIELIGTRTYDAILLDLVMPQPDGFEVLRHIETIPSLLERVIVITGYPQQVASARVYACVSKPIDLSELVRLTRSCVKTHQ